MQRFKVTAHVGIRRPIHFLVWADSLDQANKLAGGDDMFSGPDDSLRPLIENKMHALDVDPGLRGWHNYDVAEVVLHYGEPERLAASLRAAGVTQDQLEDALSRAIFQDEIEPDQAREIYGTAQADLVMARIRRRAERIRERRGYLGLVVALGKKGVRTIEAVRAS